MYNLLMSASDTYWDDGRALVGLSRYLEYTSEALTAKFKSLSEETIRKLVRIPALFAYELHVKRSARVGWITEIRVRQSEIGISFEIDKSIPPITPEQIQKIYWDLDINEKSEVYRTHWAIKDVDLLEILRKNGIIKGGGQRRKSKRPLIPPYAKRTAGRKQALELPRRKKNTARKAKVFVVHGRADGPKRQISRFLKRIGVPRALAGTPVVPERFNRGPRFLLYVLWLMGK